MTKDVVALDGLLNRTAGYVSARGGEYPVAACNAVDYQIIQRAMSNDPTLTMAECLGLAQKLCPTLPADVWDAADTTIVGVIFGQSRKLIERVEAALPNSSGPTTTSPSPADSAVSPAS